MSLIYLDSAASTCMHAEVIEVMTNQMKSCYGNPSSTHAFGRNAKSGIELVRKQIANELGVSTSEIFFTSGGTESNNMIIRCAVQKFDVKRIITSNLEHKCVKETTKNLAENGVRLELVKTDEKGSIDLFDLESKLKASSDATLVTLMHANNEIGNILDIKKVAKLCKENAAYFHSDTVQTIAHYRMNLEEIGVDFISGAAHKFHGPKGIGFAYIKKSMGLSALITGGGQERNMRSGTENVAGIVGMGKAFEMAYNDLENHTKKIKSLKQYAIEKLKDCIPNIKFNGLSADLENSLYTVLSVVLPFRDNLIGFELELKNILVSQGSACSSGASKDSEVIQSLYSEKELEGLTPLRISFSTYNTKEEIDFLCKTLQQITEKKTLKKDGQLA